jgi:glycosyltransferase involved in cell wall biosynthesis
MTPLLSIIIPVYNVEPYLVRCIDSVLSQSFEDYEVICINDGSTDGSLSVLSGLAQPTNKITIISQTNKGLSAARNSGIRAARGEYLLFLDSDDWIEPDALQILASNIQNEDLICFNGRRFFEGGKTEDADAGINETGLTGWQYYNKYALVSRKFHFVCTVLRLYKRDFLLKYSLFFEEGIFHEDNLFTPIVCYHAQSVKIIPECLYVYRIRHGSIMQTAHIRRLFDSITIANALAGFFIPLQNIDKSIIYRQIAGEYFKNFSSGQKKVYGNNDQLLKEKINWAYFKAVSIYPRHKRIYFLLALSPELFRLYELSEKYGKRMLNIPE